MRQTFVDRFWSKVDRSGGPDSCWPWLASTSGQGYGQFYAHQDGRRMTLRAHRVALSLSLGRDLEPDEQGLHDCDNPPCCNPNPGHVRPGTQVENIAGMVARRRGLVGDLNGMRRHPDRRPRHERHGKTRLTMSQVRAIRALAGRVSQVDIGVRFGVPRSTVGHIIRETRWTPDYAQAS